MKCLKCNNEIDDNLKYCPQCGVKIDSDNKHKPIKILLFIIGIFIFVILIIVLVLIKNKDNKYYRKINFEYEDSSFIYRDVNLDIPKSRMLFLQDYNSYKEIIDKYEFSFKISESDFNLYNYLILFDENDCDSDSEVTSIKYNDKSNKLLVDTTFYKRCGFCYHHFDIYLYKFDKIEATNIKINNNYHKGKSEKCNSDVAYKPI